MHLHGSFYFFVQFVFCSLFYFVFSSFIFLCKKNTKECLRKRKRMTKRTTKSVLVNGRRPQLLPVQQLSLRPRKKTLSAPVVNATKAAAKAAVAQTPPGKRDKPPESTGEDLKDQKDKRPLTHEVLAEKFKCFTVVKKADYGSHVGIPVNMMQQETVLLCTKCPANKKSGKNWLGTMKAQRLQEHMGMFHSEGTPATPAKTAKDWGFESDGSSEDLSAPTTAEATPSKTISFTDALVRGIIRAGLSASQAAKVVEEWGPFLTCVFNEDKPRINEEKIRALIERHLVAQDEDYRRFFADTEHVGLSFDGGTSEAFGMHLIVTYVFTAQKRIALPIVYLTNGNAFNGASLAETIVRQLREYNIDLGKVRVCVMDGAPYNGTAVDGLDGLIALVDDLANETGVVDEVLEKTTEWYGRLKTAVSEGLAGIPTFLCKGHLTKTRIDKAMKDAKWENSVAWMFVNFVCCSLHNAPTRQTARQEENEGEKGGDADH